MMYPASQHRDWSQKAKTLAASQSQEAMTEHLTRQASRHEMLAKIADATTALRSRPRRSKP
jgi:hypothetical protein